jgi:hypothetical protein
VHVAYLAAEAAAGRPYERIAEALHRNGEGVRAKLHGLLAGTDPCPDLARPYLQTIRQRQAEAEAARKDAETRGRGDAENAVAAKEVSLSVEMYRELSRKEAAALARLNLVVERADLLLAALMVLADKLIPHQVNPICRMLAGLIDTGTLCRLVFIASGASDPQRTDTAKPLTVLASTPTSPTASAAPVAMEGTVP